MYGDIKPGQHLWKKWRNLLDFIPVVPSITAATSDLEHWYKSAEAAFDHLSPSLYFRSVHAKEAVQRVEGNRDRSYIELMQPHWAVFR